LAELPDPWVRWRPSPARGHARAGGDRPCPVPRDWRWSLSQPQPPRKIGESGTTRPYRGCYRIAAATVVRSAERALTRGRAQVAAGSFSAGSAGGVTEGGEQYTTVAAVAVTCCSSRPTVGDRPDQHVTVVATTMVRCRPCPARSVATRPRRGGRQRCSIFAEPRSAPSRPRPPGLIDACGSPAAPVQPHQCGSVTTLVDHGPLAPARSVRGHSGTARQPGHRVIQPTSWVSRGPDETHTVDLIAQTSAFPQ
jgi:hypothetical protein